MPQPHSCTAPRPCTAPPPCTAHAARDTTRPSAGAPQPRLPHGPAHRHDGPQPPHPTVCPQPANGARTGEYRDPTAGSLVRRHRRGRHPRARHPRARHPRGRQPPARHPRARSPQAHGPRTRRPRACRPRAPRPPACHPRGRHPGDRPRRRRRQLALARPASPLRPRRRRGQGRRLRVGRRAGRPCPARSRLPPLLRRPAAGGPRHPRQHPWRDAGRARRPAPARNPATPRTASPRC